MNWTLGKKISIVITFLILITSIGLGLFSISISSRSLTENIENDMIEYSVASANHISKVLKDELRILEELATRERIRSMDFSIQKEALNPDFERFEYIDFGIVSLDGTVEFVKSGEISNLLELPVIKKALDNKASISEVYIGENDQPLIMEAVPIISDNKVKGALLAINDAAFLQDIVSGLKNGEKGYSFIFGSDMTIYAHPELFLVIEQRNIKKDIESGGSTAKFGEAFLNLGAGKTGMANYDFEGFKRFAAVTPIPGTDWTLASANTAEEVLKGVNTLKKSLFGISVAFLFIGIIIAIIFSRNISKPIVILKDQASEIANLNLNVKIETSLLNRKDEIGNLANAFKTLSSSLSAIVSDIDQAANLVGEASNQMNLTTDQSASASEEIANTIENIAKGALNQAEETEKGVESLSILNDMIKASLKPIWRTTPRNDSASL